MEDLNDVLKDNSNNDKLLIKELSTLIKNHKEQNKPINMDFIMKVIKIVQSNDEDLLLKNIEIDNYASFAYAEFGHNELILYVNELNKSFNYKKYSTHKKINDKRLLAYYNIIQIILHEFTHCKQEKLADENNQKYYELSYKLCREYYEEYLLNYDIIPIERYADLRSKIIAYEVLSRVYDKEKIKEFKIKELNSLIRGYLFDYDEGIMYSPLERFNILTEYEELTSSELDLSEYKELYNRLYLGLDITPYEYDKVLEIMEKTYDNEYDTHQNNKVLINRKNSIRHI